MEKLDSVRRVMEHGKVQNLFGRFGGAFVDVTGIICLERFKIGVPFAHGRN